MSTPTTFWLRPVAPFRLDLTAWALRRRAHNVIDRWNGRVYRRALVVSGSAIEVAVAQVGSLDSPCLRVTLTGPRIESDAKAMVRESLKRLLGLQIDLARFYRRTAADPTLTLLVSRFRGLKPPRFTTMFETLVNALACQQMSLSVGILLLNRLTDKFGLAVEGAGEVIHAFPRLGIRPGVQRDAHPGITQAIVGKAGDVSASKEAP